MPQPWTVRGNVGQPPTFKEHITDKDSPPVLNFSIATPTIKDKDGNKQTLWTEISCLDNVAREMAVKINSGMRLAVSGTVYLDTYTDKNGLVIPVIRMRGYEFEKLIYVTEPLMD